MSTILSNPRGVDGQPASFAGSDFPYEVASGATVTAGKCVVFNATSKVALALTNSNRSLVLGVAVKSAGAGQIVSIRQNGVIEVDCDSGVAAGDLLMRSATNAGSVATASAPGAGTATGVLGVALAAVSGGKVLAYINPSFARATG